MNNTISEKTIGRLSLYRRFLLEQQANKSTHIYSHELARLAAVTAAQVRRDFMAIGYEGNPVRGYEVESLITSIEDVIDSPQGQKVALMGIGNLGRAILTYFHGRRPKLQIVAAFDTDPEKTDRLFHSCRCYPLDQLDRVVAEQGIDTAIVTVPAEYAQNITDRLIQNGIRGILNFAPARLKVPDGVYVENIDMIMSLEKVSFFARQK